MRSLTGLVSGSSSSAMRRGANSGSRILRNFLWSGGSICSGIIGRTFWRSTADMLDEKTSGLRNASSISPRLCEQEALGPAEPPLDPAPPTDDHHPVVDGDDGRRVAHGPVCRLRVAGH